MDHDETRRTQGTGAVENPGLVYSAKEQELIRQLVQSRLEQKSEMEYESFDGYEVPPRTQFSMLKKPAVSIKYGSIIFNMACIRLFKGVIHILPIVHTKKKRLAVVICTEEESASVEWARYKNAVLVNKTISSPEFTEKLYRMMGDWDRNCRYKALGRVAASDRGLILVFDLPEALMFPALPEEYVDKRTGEKRKRRFKYYPDEYKDRIGKSYNDYAAAHQISLFEDLDGYIGRTYEDAPSSEYPSSTPIEIVPSIVESGDDHETE